VAIEDSRCPGLNGRRELHNHVDASTQISTLMK